MLDHVGVPVGGVAHQVVSCLSTTTWIMDPGAGDPVRVADHVAVAERRQVAGHLLPVPLHHDLMGRRVGQHHLVPAGGDVAGGVVAAEKTAAEVQPVQIGFDVHPGAGEPVVLRARSALPCPDERLCGRAVAAAGHSGG